MALCLHTDIIPGRPVAQKLFFFFFILFSNSCHEFNGLFELFGLCYIIAFWNINTLRWPETTETSTSAAQSLLATLGKLSAEGICCVATDPGRGFGIVLASCLSWLTCGGCGARVTSSGARRSGGVPKETPASLVTATNTGVTSITSSRPPHLLCHLSPFISLLFGLIISLSSPLASLFPSPIILHWLIFFLFFFLYRSWSAVRGIPRTQQAC